jgi:transposase InsO family protein
MRMRGVGAVEQRLDMVLAPERYGLTVTEAAAMWGVSRQTWHVWRRRYDADGVAGLADRPSAPRSSPGRVSGRVEVEVLRLREAHPRWGPRRIGTELARRGLPAPARSTIQRILVRHGVLPVRPAPVPPPQRFERARPNELWQTDATDWVLTDGGEVAIISVLDDHSRYCAAAAASASATREDAIAAFDLAAAEIGLPQAVLSDRGTIFTGRTTGCVVAFERHLWALGVATVNGRAYHPQTQGKIERYHRTLSEWLTDEGPFADLAALNDELDRFRLDYNTARPHQAIGDVTPAERFAATAPAGPDPDSTTARRRRESRRNTMSNGNLGYGEWIIGLGTAWANTKVLVVDLGHTIEIRSGDQLVRAVTPDHTRGYLGTGKPRPGRPPRQLR